MSDDITQEEIDEGLSLFYGDSVTIEPPRKKIVRRKGKMLEVEEPAFVKFYTDFKDELKNMDGYALKVFVYIGLSIGFESGEAFPGSRKIAEETGMDKETVLKSVQYLEDNGFMTVYRKHGSSNVYKPVKYFSIGSGRSDRTVAEVDGEREKVDGFNAEVDGLSRVNLLNQINKKEPDSDKVFFDEEKAGIDWLIAANKPVTQKAVNRQAEIFDREIMIDRELSRLPLLWSGFKEQEQDRFRKFIKKQAAEGRNLETWVNWWMSDEQRVANPPWTLGIIMTRWLQGFPKERKTQDVQKDDNGITISYA